MTHTMWGVTSLSAALVPPWTSEIFSPIVEGIDRSNSMRTDDIAPRVPFIESGRKQSKNLDVFLGIFCSFLAGMKVQAAFQMRTSDDRWLSDALFGLVWLALAISCVWRGLAQVRKGIISSASTNQ